MPAIDNEVRARAQAEERFDEITERDARLVIRRRRRKALDIVFGPLEQPQDLRGVPYAIARGGAFAEQGQVRQQIHGRPPGNGADLDVSVLVEEPREPLAS